MAELVGFFSALCFLLVFMLSLTLCISLILGVEVCGHSALSPLWVALHSRYSFPCEICWRFIRSILGLYPLVSDTLDLFRSSEGQVPAGPRIHFQFPRPTGSYPTRNLCSSASQSSTSPDLTRSSLLDSITAEPKNPKRPLQASSSGLTCLRFFSFLQPSPV